MIETEDQKAFLETLRANRDHFEGGGDVVISRAPGRLDVMGGIADYSGSMVLEMPIAEAAFAAVQKTDRQQIRIVSIGGDGSRVRSFVMPLGDLFPAGKKVDYEAARGYFCRGATASWAAYVAGAFVVLMNEKDLVLRHGANVLLDSAVPEGKGVSSSAAIEVAAMTAIAAAYEIALEPRELAILCQMVENLVVGAPCGIMDQMTSVLGSSGQLLSMACQPAEVLGNVDLPADAAVWGIDSGIRHSVGGGDYGSVRTGAFMGYRIIADAAGFTSRNAGEGRVEIVDPKFNGYLANITPDEFERQFAPVVPRTISGREFLERFRGITDAVTSVEPARNYEVFFPTRHPIYENSRVRAFAAIMSSPQPDLRSMGELMYASHKSYSDCGLGREGTDLLVEMARASTGLYGAKITGGGSGGTVAVLGPKGAEAEIVRVADQYEAETGRRPHVFSGSSAGAASFGHVRLTLGRDI